MVNLSIGKLLYMLTGLEDNKWWTYRNIIHLLIVLCRILTNLPFWLSSPLWSAVAPSLCSVCGFCSFRHYLFSFWAAIRNCHHTSSLTLFSVTHTRLHTYVHTLKQEVHSWVWQWWLVSQLPPLVCLNTRQFTLNGIEPQNRRITHLCIENVAIVFKFVFGWLYVWVHILVIVGTLKRLVRREAISGEMKLPLLAVTQCSLKMLHSWIKGWVIWVKKVFF